jgi:hypothetical protein
MAMSDCAQAKRAENTSAHSEQANREQRAKPLSPLALELPEAFLWLF